MMSLYTAVIPLKSLYCVGNSISSRAKPHMIEDIKNPSGQEAKEKLMGLEERSEALLV